MSSEQDTFLAMALMGKTQLGAHVLASRVNCVPEHVSVKQISYYWLAVPFRREC